MGRALKLSNTDFSSVALTQVTFIDQIPCTGLSLTPSSLTFESAEESKQLTATKVPSDTTDTLSWSSSNSNVATVDSTGLVTIHGIGTATITATCGNQTASVTITQSSIKAQYSLKTLTGRYPYKNAVSEDNAYISTSSGAVTETSVGQAYHAENTDLMLPSSSTIDLECVRVPYGATMVYVKTSDDVEVTLSYMHVASTTDKTTTPGGLVCPKWLRTKEFYKTNTGYAVQYGECFVFRPGNNKDISTLSYIYFE